MTAGFHVYFGPNALAAPPPVVRRIHANDCFAALAEGFDDFLAMRTYPIFIGLFYAMAGIVLVALTSFGNALHLAFPFAAGFAIIGPFFALGLYEMSRRRELRGSAAWRDAFAVLSSPALPSILVGGLLLFAIFALWIIAAQLLYMWLYGPNPPAAALPFLQDVLTTGRGWTLIVAGGLVGFCFAALALCLSIVSFPLMLDRDVGLIPALGASLRTARMNPLPVALWGLIVAAALILGSLPLFFGLAVVMPALGHATWRFYRKAIARDPAREVPVELPPGETLVETPLLRSIWIFLDCLDALRRKMWI